MSDWLFNDGLSTAWDTPVAGHGLDHVDHGPQYLLNDDGQLTLVSEARGGHGGSAGGGGVTGTTVGGGAAVAGNTLVGPATGLQIDLFWDASVLSAPNAASIEHSVVAAAQIFTTHFSTHAVLNIHVGLGEVNGATMSASSLGQSYALGHLVSYASLTGALKTADAGLVASGLMASGATTFVTGLASKTFFVPNAEAKALGLLSPTSTGADGYIGLSASSAMSFTGVVGAGQWDAVGVATHEIAEVMGRLASDGAFSGYYTPLDLFRYASADHPQLTTATGYFSTNLGVTALNAFNTGGGDKGDWATTTANRFDAFDAFANSGGAEHVSANDFVEMSALGWTLAGAPVTVTA